MGNSERGFATKDLTFKAAFGAAQFLTLWKNL
jgi:hypothetical protein